MVTVRNKDKLLRKHRLLKEDKFLRAVNAAVFEAADMARAAAFRSISAGSASDKRHKASQPGHAPNRDSGVLQNNIETTNPKPFVGRVTSSAPYSDALEFGTSKMEARPFMRPAREKTREPAREMLIKRLKVFVRTL